MKTEPAFPIVGLDNEDEYVEAHGLTKREYFAAMAMQGILASGDDNAKRVAKDSIRLANTLIAALESEEE